MHIDDAAYVRPPKRLAARWGRNRVFHDREYESDNEAAEDPTKLLDVIRRDIKLHGPLTDEQRARLSYIATRCPVHKTLLNGPRIVDEVSVTA